MFEKVNEKIRRKQIKQMKKGTKPHKRLKLHDLYA